MKRSTCHEPSALKTAVGRPLRPRAFTIIELIMVMIIIGIVAALALPRISLLTQRSEVAALDADLRILQNGIELYAADHAGDYPAGRSDAIGNDGRTEGAFVSQMTMYTDRYGRASAQKTSAYKYGPYLLGGVPPLPTGSKKGATSVAIVLTTPAPQPGSDAGWIYNPLTGEIIGNVGATEFTDFKPSQMALIGP